MPLKRVQSGLTLQRLHVLPAAHTGAVDGQSLEEAQATQEPVALQMGVVPPQLALDVHATQPSDGLQKGVAGVAAQSGLAEQRGVAMLAAMLYASSRFIMPPAIEDHLPF